MGIDEATRAIFSIRDHYLNLLGHVPKVFVQKVYFDRVFGTILTDSNGLEDQDVKFILEYAGKLNLI